MKQNINEFLKKKMDALRYLTVQLRETKNQSHHSCFKVVWTILIKAHMSVLGIYDCSGWPNVLWFMYQQDMTFTSNLNGNCVTARHGIPLAAVMSGVMSVRLNTHSQSEAVWFLHNRKSQIFYFFVCLFVLSWICDLLKESDFLT